MNHLAGVVRKLWHTTKMSYMFMVNRIEGVEPKKAVFISFDGKSYSDNPKAISEKLHELHPDFEIVWMFGNAEEKRKIVPDYVKCVQAGSFEALRELATSKFWVDNFCKPLFIYKGKNQFYIQTGHGDRGFKKVLYDVRTLLPNGHYKEGDLAEPEICDLGVSGSEFMNRLYRSAFGYEGEILTCGSPRNDQLLVCDKSKAKAVRETLKLDMGIKILLYAPTFRDSKLGSAQGFDGIDLRSVIRSLEDKTGDRWVCLVRSHSSASGFENQRLFNDRLTDVTAYEDMSDLLLISDMLITDYSSSAGDFALLGRPIILFQNDREEYVKKDRTFYFDIDESPYIVALNQDQLIDIIRNMEMDKAAQNCRDILRFYGASETGKSSEAVANYIISKLK
jgi:CDP-glycerol glycerophosphotransferase